MEREAAQAPSDEPPRRPATTPRRLLVLIVLGAAGGLGVALPLGRGLQRRHDERLAPRILRGIPPSQELYRERHPELHYAARLEELDAHWGSGIYADYNRYRYELLPPPGDPRFTWAARATPLVDPGEWRHYYLDHLGLVRWEQGRPAGPASPVWKEDEPR